MKNVVFFYLLLNINIILTKQNDIISFKLHSYEDNIITKNKDDISSVFSIIKKAYIYTDIKIGEPEYLIECKFSTNALHFAMFYNEEELNENNKNKKYDIKNSKSFKNITNLNKYFIRTKNDIHAIEKFKMNFFDLNKKINKEIIINDFDFVLVDKFHKKNNFSEIYYSSIGLSIFDNTLNEFNFIKNLKNNNLIKKYIWFIYYEKKETEKNEEINKLENLFNINKFFLLGDFPHNYKPNEFSKEQIYNIYTKGNFWSFKFKSLYFYENENDNKNKLNNNKKKQELFSSNCQISLNDIFIYAPYDYLIKIKKSFFDFYINKNICQVFIDEDIESFYCFKSNYFNINNLKEFPTLYFEHNEFNYTFELSYKDLFIEYNEKYFFLIVNMNNDADDYFLGRIFLYKYQFYFNPDSKSIGFYNPNIKFNKSNNENTIVSNENNSKYLIYIIVLGSLLFISVICIFIIFFKNYKNKKRKRANELDDEYDYVSSNKIIN